MDDYSSFLLQTLRQELSVCRTDTNKTEIIIRCVYCGDSVKSQSSAHFYIQASSPYYCYCQRCGTKSMVSLEMLKDFKISNPKLRIETARMEKDRKFNMGRSIKKGDNAYIQSFLNVNDFKIPPVKGLDSEKIKLDYLNERLGLTLDLKDVYKFNIITNFKEFIVKNNIDIMSNKVELVKKLNKYCIGFLSQDKNFIIFRSMDPELTNFRYHVYNITGQYSNTRKYYTIKQDIDLLNPDVKIVITEGIIDLISVYINIYKGKVKPNTVFVSTNGIGMNLVINTVCKLGFLNPQIEIYADRDVSLSKLRHIKNNSDFILPHNKITVFYNKLEKDVGCPLEKIELQKTFI